MALYRIYGDDRQYLNFVIPVSEVIQKLGKSHPIHIDRTPIPYKDIWKEPLEIDFMYGNETAGKLIPDIIDNNGRLFLSEKAYTELNELLNKVGEFLPVYYTDGKGYIFNPLKTAESESAIDKKSITHDEHGFLSNFSFIEEKLNNISVFKTELDTYLGLFCTAEFKSKVENADLKGIAFGQDISNPVGESYGVKH